MTKINGARKVLRVAAFVGFLTVSFSSIPGAAFAAGPDDFQAPLVGDLGSTAGLNDDFQAPLHMDDVQVPHQVVVTSEDGIRHGE